MTDRERKTPSDPVDPYAWSYEAHAERQARLGLQLTPAERLRWLEETNAMMRDLLGKARSAAAAPISPRPSDEGKTTD